MMTKLMRHAVFVWRSLPAAVIVLYSGGGFITRKDQSV